MWHLERPTRDTLSWYKKLILVDLRERIVNASDLDQKIKNRLVYPGRAKNKVLKQLLLSPPEILYGYNDRLEKKFEREGLWTEENKGKLLKVFNYDGVLSHNKTNSYELTKHIGKNSCTYCNRIYTQTVVEDDSRIARPDIDHWLNKSDHPLLSLSIYNMIPSCQICNRTIKQKVEFEYGKHVHPYDKATVQFRFGYSCGTGGRWDVKLLNCTSKEAQMAKDLKTLQMYQPHGVMEVKDLLDFATDNTPEYLEGLCEYVMRRGKNVLTWDDAYRLMFGTERNEEKYLDRPLSKLKHDILVQLKEEMKRWK